MLGHCSLVPEHRNFVSQDLRFLTLLRTLEQMFQQVLKIRSNQMKTARDQPECWGGGGLGWTDKVETKSKLETLVMCGHSRELWQRAPNGF